MKTFYAVVIMVLIGWHSWGNPAFMQQKFIDTYVNVAVEEMIRTGIPASIKMAQAALESNWGRSRTAVEGNNYFCIKCYNGWLGDTLMQKDDEQGESCFRVYSSQLESFQDHSKFLTTQQRYQTLFSLEPFDFEGWARGLKSCGYASDKDYDTKIINLINDYGLYIYDFAMPAKIVLNKPVINYPVPGNRVNQVAYKATSWNDSNEGQNGRQGLILESPSYWIPYHESSQSSALTAQKPEVGWLESSYSGSMKIKVIHPLPEP
jgi:hypothetical protein